MLAVALMIIALSSVSLRAGRRELGVAADRRSSTFRPYIPPETDAIGKLRFIPKSSG
jgi:hypothetical protein